jgi:hypothetical protein
VIELGLEQVTSQPHQKCPLEIWGEKRNYQINSVLKMNALRPVV